MGETPAGARGRIPHDLATLGAEGLAPDAIGEGAEELRGRAKLRGLLRAVDKLPVDGDRAFFVEPGGVAGAEVGKGELGRKVPGMPAHAQDGKAKQEPIEIPAETEAAHHTRLLLRGGVGKPPRGTVPQRESKWVMEICDVAHRRGAGPILP